MRIRKRFLSLSAATGEPLVMVQHPELHPVIATQIGLQPVSWGASSDSKETKEMKYEKDKDLIKTDDIGRKESILCEEAKSHVLGWLDGDMLIPVKKRRGSYGKSVSHVCQEDNEGKIKPDPKKMEKKEKREDVIMERSRCSRVNGRGWRCGQQPLFGFSMCQHHIGQGRLRTMNSVRARAQKVSLKEQETKERQDEEIETTSINYQEREEFKHPKVESMSSMEGQKELSKKKKVGVVKERSLSSLLSQIGN